MFVVLRDLKVAMPLIQEQIESFFSNIICSYGRIFDSHKENNRNNDHCDQTNAMMPMVIAVRSLLSLLPKVYFVVGFGCSFPILVASGIFGTAA